MKPERSTRAFCRIAFCLALLVAPASAQEHEVPKFELFGGYSYLHSQGESLNGWKVVAVGNVNHWFGIAADFDGYYRSASTAHGSEKESEHSFTFGPHFTLRKKRLVPFAYALFGVARESASLGATSESATGFATELGGGLDYEVNEHLAVRLLDASASITRIEDHTRTKPKLSFGLVFHFGHGSTGNDHGETEHQAPARPGGSAT